MSLIVEDGSIVEDAESYIGVDDADVEIANRGGNTQWDSLTITQKEVQLRLATEYMDNNYCFIGYLVSGLQELAWPRGGTKFDDDVIPKVVKRATAVLAAESIDLPLYTSLGSSSTTGAQIKKTKDKLDVLETEVEYFQGDGGNSQTSFVEVGSILKPVLVGKAAYRG